LNTWLRFQSARISAWLDFRLAPTVTYTFPAHEVINIYVACLNETFVSSDAIIETRTHQFQTPGGTTHLIDNWSYTTLFTGQSGRQWAGSGVSPFHMNVRLDGGGYGWTTKRILDPLDGVGPSLVFTATLKFMMNALGEVVVDIAPVPGANYNCLGPKS